MACSSKSCHGRIHRDRSHTLSTGFRELVDVDAERREKGWPSTRCKFVVVCGELSSALHLHPLSLIISSQRLSETNANLPQFPTRTNCTRPPKLQTFLVPSAHHRRPFFHHFLSRTNCFLCRRGVKNINADSCILSTQGISRAWIPPDTRLLRTLL